MQTQDERKQQTDREDSIFVYMRIYTQRRRGMKEGHGEIHTQNDTDKRIGMHILADIFTIQIIDMSLSI